MRFWPPIPPTIWCPTSATWRPRAGCNWASTTRPKNSTPNLLQKYPQHADAESWKVRQGTALHLQKKYPEVVALLQPLVAQIKNADARAEALFLIGSSLAEQKQFAEAVPRAGGLRWPLLLAGVRPTRRCLVLGQAYYRQKDPAKANATLKKLVAEFPQSKVLDRAHFRLGEYATAANDLKTAEAEYRLVVEKWPASSLLVLMPCAGWAGRFSIRKSFADGGRGIQHAGREISRSEAETPQPLCPRSGPASFGQVQRGGCRLAGLSGRTGIEHGREVRRPLCAGPEPRRPEEAGRSGGHVPSRC